MKKNILQSLPKEFDVIVVHENSRIPKVLKKYLNRIELHQCRGDPEAPLAIIFFYKENRKRFEKNSINTCCPT